MLGVTQTGDDLKLAASGFRLSPSLLSRSFSSQMLFKVTDQRFGLNLPKLHSDDRYHSLADRP